MKRSGKCGIYVKQAPGLAFCKGYVHPIQAQIGFHHRLIDLEGNILEISIGNALVEHDDRFQVQPTLPGIELAGQFSEQSALASDIIGALNTGPGIKSHPQLGWGCHP